ncbi:hypothetical protein Bca4012_001340 [Brassica carinata]
MEVSKEHRNQSTKSATSRAENWKRMNTCDSTCSFTISSRNPRSCLSSSISITLLRSAAEIVREVTLLAIERQNEAKGTKLVLAEHIQANYQFVSGILCWLSFWAVDMNSSSTPESKIYQAKIWQRGKEHKLLLFRLKPTDEEIASVEVVPPPPMLCEDSDEEAVVFSRAGPEDDPRLPFVFHRTGADPRLPLLLRSDTMTTSSSCRQTK